ncbi:MAG: hypothetical protein HY895_10930 [Deltaproteobacteria bacterium]|nr:hypothetical protein [Deltaproteobacteria bacterium]
MADFVNDIYAKKDTLRPNHRRYRPVSIIDIIRLLPNTNCGKCGYPTCIAFSAALRQAEASPELCPAFPQPVYKQAVYHQHDLNGRITSTVILEIDDMMRRPLLNQDSNSSNPSTHAIASTESKITPLSDLPTEGTYGPLTNREKEVLRLLIVPATRDAGIKITNLLNQLIMAFLNDRLAPFHRVADPRSTYPQSLRQCPERYPRLPDSPIAQKAPGLYLLLLTSLRENLFLFHILPWALLSSHQCAVPAGFLIIQG